MIKTLKWKRNLKMLSNVHLFRVFPLWWNLHHGIPHDGWIALHVSMLNVLHNISPMHSQCHKKLMLVAHSKYLLVCLKTNGIKLASSLWGIDAWVFVSDKASKHQIMHVWIAPIYYNFFEKFAKLQMCNKKMEMSLQLESYAFCFKDANHDSNQCTLFV